MQWTAEEPAARLDTCLAARFSGHSRSRIQDWIRAGQVLVNGRPAKPRQPVARGDQISVAIPEPVPAHAVPEPIPLAVLFEDRHLVVIDKPSGLVVHPAAGHPTGTLVNALLHHCGTLAAVGGIQRPGIVHRLDKDTSGCIVVAKDDATHRSLMTQFARRSAVKLYLAVSLPAPRPPYGAVFTHIGRHPVNRLKMAVVTPPAGKPAITGYQVLAEDPLDRTALVVCRLFTGRTHQIRVHMLHLGAPLLGDPIYARPPRQPVAPGRLMLHAWHLEFDHPHAGNRVRVTAPIPPEFDHWLALAGHIPDPHDPNLAAG
jgi:23S rRNA pseudouridine1911/1915/1917 synthase